VIDRKGVVVRPCDDVTHATMTSHTTMMTSGHVMRGGVRYLFIGSDGALGEGDALAERVDAPGDAAVGRQADVLAPRVVELHDRLATAAFAIVGT